MCAGSVSTVPNAQHRGSTSVTDLALEARNLLDLAQVIDGYDGPIDDAVYAAWSRIEAARAQLAIASGDLARRLAESMPGKRYTVDGVGTFERHRKSDRKYWEKDLVRRVLDSRIVDTETGEVLDETPLSKVLAVWNLGAPRITALHERAIDPDEWCTVEPGALTLQQVG